MRVGGTVISRRSQAPRRHMPLLHITWHKKSNNPTPRKRGHTKVSKLTGEGPGGLLKTYALAVQEKL
jgi:hypothetical protein